MNFKDAVEIIIKAEGGSKLTQDPRDPGGTTRWGISQNAYPKEDIVNMTRERAEALYKRDYWDKLGCDNLPPFIRLMVFDCAVNQGAGAAKKFLTQAPVTKTTRSDLIVWFANERLRRYFENKNFLIYGNGWTKRVLHTLMLCAAEAMDD